MTVTMREVARAAGVSIATVSHVINDTRPIAPATRQRVLRAIRQLNYYKNSSARLLVRGFGDAFGLIVSDIENPFFPQLIKGFEHACGAEHLDVILRMTNYEQKSAETAVRRMIEDKVRGVAIMTREFDAELVDRLLDRDIPVVRLNDPGMRHNQSSVEIDYSAGVRQAVEHLARLGHRNVAIIHRPVRVLSARKYRRLLVDSVHDHGMRLVCCIEVESRADGGVAAVRELTARKTWPTALLCGNDLMAIGAMGQALRCGWRVPEDLSVIGSDDIAFAAYAHPRLSTVHVDKDDVGIQAFRLLQQMLAEPLNQGIALKVATRFVSRESSGPARERPVAATRGLRTGSPRSTAVPCPDPPILSG